MKSKLLPKGWELKKFGEIADFVNGRAFKPSEWDKQKKGLPIVRIQNLTNSKKPHNFFNSTTGSKYLLDKGDILISWSASLGIFRWNKGKALLNQHIFKVKIKKDIIDENYFFYVVQTKIDEMKLRVHGSTMKHITKGQFERIEIPLPPLPIQKQIGLILEKAERLKERRRKTNEETNKIIQNIFYEMFGEKDYRIIKLKYITEVITKGTTPTTYGYDYVVKGIPFLRVENINNGKINYSVGSKFIDIKTHDFLKRSQLRKNDILFTIAGAIGRSAVVNKNSPANINQAIAIIRLKKNINQEYLSNALTTTYIKKQINRMIVQVAQSNLSLTQVSNLSVPVPPIELQNKFAEQVEKIKSIKKYQQKSEQEINTLFDALMQKAFKGELVS
ncbi:restriction endonuclease subunit S [archaeon]|nr:restriction endonuclease subunit S [archaeon]